MFESTEANSAKAMTGLFKYFSPDKLTFFENRLVLLTPPKFLNDPWDFLPQGRTATDEEIFREWQKIENEIAQSSAHLPAEFARLQPKQRLQIMLTSGKSREFVEGLPKYSRDRVSSIYGIIALRAEQRKWLTKAAEQGHEWAQRRLSIQSISGDIVESYKWTRVRADAPDNDLEFINLESMKEHMTPEEIEKGEALAREFLSKPAQ
jgi:hypothetical protein